MKNTARPTAQKGFTLIEIMVVLTIVSVLIAFTIPSLEPALKGSKLKQASDDLERALASAQQVALTENVPVQFRFYSFEDDNVPGSNDEFRCYQAVVLERDPLDHQEILEERQITPVVTLPVPYVISSSQRLSTLTQRNLMMKGISDIPRADNAEYVAFEFRPDGSTNLDTVDQPFWTATIMAETESDASLPSDFVTLSLDPYNGQVRRFQ